MNNPLISVIIPVYNTKDCLTKCFDSIRNQSYTNIEVLVIDDGCTDGSSEICDKYALEDKRFKIFHKVNEGVSVARNFALDNVKGEWITFCDSDDWLHPDTLKICSEYFSNNDFIRFSGYQVFPTKTINSKFTAIKSKDQYLRLLLSRSTGLGVCGGIYCTKLFKDPLIRFNSKLYMGEDWQVQTRLLLKSENPIALNYKLYYYNRTSETSCVNSISYQKWINCFEAFEIIKKTIKTLHNQNFECEFNTTKIKIFIEAIKSIAISEKRYDNYCSCFNELKELSIIPTFSELSSNTISYPKRFISYLCSLRPFYLLFLFLYKRYKFMA